MMRKIIQIITSAIVLVAVSINSANADLSNNSKTINLDFRLGTGGQGGTYFPVGTGIAKALSNQSPVHKCSSPFCEINELSVEAVVSGASVQNVTEVEAGTMQMGIAEASILFFAYNGLNRFSGNNLTKLRVLASLYPEDLHLVVPKGTSLNSISELAGKRVGIAKQGSGTHVAVEAILSEFGISRSDYTPYEIGSSDSAELMQKGKLDAYFFTAGAPVSRIAELSKSGTVELYSFSEEEVRSISKLLPYFTPSVIQGNTYDGLSEAVKTVAVNAMLVTHADLPEPLIYELTKLLWTDQSASITADAHRKGASITLDTALNGLEGLGVPLHKGAEKYYKRVCQFIVPRSPERYKRYPIECS